MLKICDKLLVRLLSLLFKVFWQFLFSRITEIIECYTSPQKMTKKYFNKKSVTACSEPGICLRENQDKRNPPKLLFHQHSYPTLKEYFTNALLK